MAKQQAEAAAKQKSEALAAQAAANAQAKQTALSAIKKKVENNWIRPLSAGSGLKCTIRVKLLSSGEVMDTMIVTSSGDSGFDSSAESAVKKASPLPIPSDKELFNKDFRSFEFVFNP